MLGTPNDSTILRLRVKGSDLDPLALRGRMENLLNDLSLTPRLPASATLFIRRLSDPLPGALQLDTSYPRPPQAWRHAFNQRFDELVSSAARPALGPVSDSVESVVFYDYAELLASLSADWARGLVTSRWWWQSLIKRGEVLQMIKQLWREKIEYVPAALERLARRDALVEFVSSWSEAETQELVRRVVRTFGLHALRETVQPQITQIIKPDLPREVREDREVILARAVMPWRYMVPESGTPRLQPIQQLFVGVALMVQRAPARVRTVSFAREVEQWIERVVHVSPVAETIIAETVEITSPATPSAPTPPHLIRENPIEAPPESSTTAPPNTKSVSSAAEVVEPIGVSEELTPITSEIPPVNELPPVLHDERTPVEPVAQEVLIPPTETLDALTIETQLGGLFYLINLGIFLEIYSDFTNPVERTELNIWDFVALVGAELLDEQEADDPIWSLLADLARPASQDLHDVHDIHSVNPVNLVKPDWLAEMLPFIRTRLRQALGIDDQADLGAILLCHHAKITTTATHIDVYFPLSDHPIEIRLSGLDRNPGWVPAAGRFIAFHYD
jgi:hypothetical protein